MAMNLQDVDATLEDTVSKSQNRLFGSSSKHLSVVSSQALEVEEDSDDGDGVETDDTSSEASDSDADGDDIGIDSSEENEEEDRDEPPPSNLQNMGRT